MGCEILAEVFEMFMLLAFGFSWPISIYKSVKSRTAKGKSVAFMCLILFGYVCGIISKLVHGTLTYVFIFYIINFIAVSIDLGFCLRNQKLDIARDGK